MYIMQTLHRIQQRLLKCLCHANAIIEYMNLKTFYITGHHDFNSHTFTVAQSIVEQIQEHLFCLIPIKSAHIIREHEFQMNVRLFQTRHYLTHDFTD